MHMRIMLTPGKLLTYFKVAKSLFNEDTGKNTDLLVVYN